MKLLKKTSRMFAIIGTGVLSLCATIACTVSTMAWYSHLNTPITGVVESDSTDLTIQSVSGYKNMLVTDNNGFVVDGGVVPISGSSSGSGSNIDQGTEDTSFDVPTEGTGYYLVRQVNGTFKYANSIKFSEYESTHRAVIPKISDLPAGALFQVRKYDFEVVGGETKTVSEPLVFTSNSSLFGATLSDGNVSLTSAGTFRVWLDHSNNTLGFELIEIQGQSVSSFDYSKTSVELESLGDFQKLSLNGSTKSIFNQNSQGEIRTKSSNQRPKAAVSGSGFRKWFFIKDSTGWNADYNIHVWGTGGDASGTKWRLNSWPITTISGTTYRYHEIEDSSKWETMQVTQIDGGGNWNYKSDDISIVGKDKAEITVSSKFSATTSTISYTATVLLKGDFNSWGDSDQMSVNSSGIATFSKVKISQNEKFKVTTQYSVVSTSLVWNGFPGDSAAATALNTLGFNAEYGNGGDNVVCGNTGYYDVSIDLKTNNISVSKSSKTFTLNKALVDSDGTIINATYASATYPVTAGAYEVSKTAIETALDTTTVITGYTYSGGWFKDSLLTQQVTFSNSKFDPFGAIDGTDLYAKWVADEYTIAYNGLEGASVSTPNPASYTIESDDINLNNPTKTGYTFKGWSGTGLDGDSNTSVTIPAGSYGTRSYTANWTADTFTIAFDANGGSGSTASVSAAYNETATLTQNGFSYSGHRFDGWATSANGSKVYNDKTVLTAEQVNAMYSTQGVGKNGTYTLYAHWVEVETKTVTISLGNNQTGYGSVDNASFTVPVNSTYEASGTILTFTDEWGNETVVTATPTDPSAEFTYAFSSWSSESGTVTENTAITANFTRTTNTYTVNIVSNNGDYGTVSQSSVASVPYGTALTASGNKVTINGTQVTATPTQSGAQYTYAFADWTNGTATVEGNLTVTANFTRTLNNYTVTIVSNNGDYGAVSQDSVASVPYGTALTASGNKVTINGTQVTATPTQSGAQYTYAFADWTNGTATVEGNLTVTANFTRTLNSYIITFLDGDGVTIQSSSFDYGTVPVYSGSTPTKTSTAQYNYTWDEGWTPTIVSVTGAATYTATFNSAIRSYTITWANIDGAGGSSTDTVAYGQTPSYAGTPAKASSLYEVYTFTGWSPAITTVTGAQTYTAQFNSDTRYFTVILDNGDGVDNSSVTTVRYGQAMPEISVPAKTNYVFLGYYSASNGGGDVYYNYNGTSARSSDITVDNYTLYAYWGSTTGNNNDKENCFLAGETYRLSVGSGHWTSWTQRFAIYLTNDTEPELWIDLYGSNPLYSCIIPYGKWTGLVFCRMDGDTSVNNLNNCWDSTTTQSKASTEAYVKQYFEVNSNEEGQGECGGSWFSLITGGKTLYFHDTNSWGSAVMYYWTAAGVNTDAPMSSLQNGYYSATLPSGEYKGIIFHKNMQDWSGNKTGDINALSSDPKEVLYEGSGWTTLPTVFTGNNTVYMNTGGVWGEQKYAIFVYGDTNLNGQWVIMTQAATSSSYWYAAIPAGNWFRILFCKINSSVVTPAWDNNVLDQTSDLIFSSANPCMTITSGSGTKSRNANSGHGPFIGATGNQILLGFDTGLTQWKADGIKTVLKLTDGSTTEYIKMTPLEDRNGNLVCYLAVLDALLNGEWWFTFQFLRVDKDVADSDFAITNPSNIYNTVTASFPANYPANKCYYIKATNFSTGDWGQKIVKDDGFYIVGVTQSSDDTHPLISGNGNNWNLDGAQLISTSDDTNDAIWSGILLPGDVFKVVQVTNYSPNWHGYRSNPAETSSCSVFFNSSAASYTFKGDITLASSSTITAYEVTIYYPKDSSGVYISFESFDTTVAGNVKYSTLSDSKEETAATSGTIAINVPLNGDTIIDNGILAISPASLDDITYYDFYCYSLTDSTETYTGITNAVGQTITSASPTIYATYEHQTVDFVIIGSDGTNSLGQLSSGKKDKATSGGSTSHDLGSLIRSVIDNENHEIRAYSKDADDMKLYNEAGCSTYYNGALTSNVTVYLKVAQLTQKRFYIDFGSTDDPDWMVKDYVILHVKDTNGAFITSMESGEEGLLKTGKAANYLGYVSLPIGYGFQVYAASNSGFTDHASQTPEYGATIAVGSQDFLLVKNTCQDEYRQYSWCSWVDRSVMGTATIYKNGVSTTTMATANVTNNYFLYENGLSARAGDMFYVTVTGSTSPYASLARTYDGMSYMGEVPWFLDDSISITINLSNGLGWERVYVYAWDSSNLSNINATFPGEEATADNGHYLYTLSSSFDRIVISNGDGDQTVDITAAHNVHEYTVLTTKDEDGNNRDCTPGEATVQALKVTTDVRLNFYIVNDSGNPKLSIAAVPYLGNGFYIMPSINGNNAGFENAIKMLTITDTSASYVSFHAGASKSYYIRSYMSAYDHLYKDYDLSAISTKATYNPSTGIVTFGADGAGVYTITLSNDAVTITQSSDSENFRLNGLDVSAGSASIKEQKTTLILEVCISVKNTKDMNATATLTNTFGGHIGAYLYLSHAELETPWDLLRNNTNYPLISSDAILANQNAECPTIAGHSGTDYYYVYIVIDYLDKTMTATDIGGEISIVLNTVQA